METILILVSFAALALGVLWMRHDPDTYLFGVVFAATGLLLGCSVIGPYWFLVYCLAAGLAVMAVAFTWRACRDRHRHEEVPAPITRN